MVQKEGTEYLLCGLVTDVMTNVDVTFRGVDWPWFILNYPNQSQLIMINPQLPCGIGKTNCQESHCYFMKSNKTFWNSQSLLKGLHFWSSSVLLNVIVPHWCHFTVFLSTILTFRQCVLFFFIIWSEISPLIGCWRKTRRRLLHHRERDNQVRLSEFEEQIHK